MSQPTIEAEQTVFGKPVVIVDDAIPENTAVVPYGKGKTLILENIGKLPPDPEPKPHPILFLDLDGTVRHGKDELGFFASKPEHVVVFENVPEILSVYDRAGWLIVGVTNQGGVALGHLTRHDVYLMGRETVKQLGRMELICTSFDHPDASDMNACWERKPSPGLIYEAVRQLGVIFPLAPAAQCLMVGDRPEDRACASRAGVPFMDAVAWRGGGWARFLEGDLSDVESPAK